MRWEDSSQCISTSPSTELTAAVIQCLRCFCRIFCKAQRQLCTTIHEDQKFLNFWICTKSGTNSAATCKVPKVNSHALILSSSHRLCRPRRVILPVSLRHSAQSRCRLTGGLEGIFSLKRKHRNSLHSQLSNSLFSTWAWLAQPASSWCSETSLFQLAPDRSG